MMFSYRTLEITPEVDTTVMVKTMMMMSTSCFSELEVEALPSVVHVGVAEGDVVDGVVADGANHLRGNLSSQYGKLWEGEHGRGEQMFSKYTGIKIKL